MIYSAHMKRGLGQIERLLFAYVQLRGQPTVRAGEMVGPLQLSAARERNLLSRLSCGGDSCMEFSVPEGYSSPASFRLPTTTRINFSGWR